MLDCSWAVTILILNGIYFYCSIYQAKTNQNLSIYIFHSYSRGWLELHWMVLWKRSEKCDYLNFECFLKINLLYLLHRIIRSTFQIIVTGVLFIMFRLGLKCWTFLTSSLIVILTNTCDQDAVLLLLQLLPCLEYNYQIVWLLTMDYTRN